MTYSFKSLKIGILLLLYLVQSCVSNPEKYYTEADFQTVEKTDVHVHIHTKRNDFIQQARKDNFKVVTIALDITGNLDTVKKQHRYSLLQEKNNPLSIEFATAFSMENWDEPDWLEKTMTWLDSGIHDGAVAVKIWKNIGMVYRDKAGDLIMIDNPRFDPIFKMLADRKVTVIGHLGEPKNCWLPLEEMTTHNDRNYFRDYPQYHMYKHPELPSYEEQVAARDRMLEKNPDLTFVGAHLGSLEWDVEALGKTLDKFPNMAVDMAARMGQLFYQTHYDRKKVREFFIKYQDRLLYATDMGDYEDEPNASLIQNMHETWLRDWRFLVTDDVMTSDLVDDEFQGLQLPQNVVDKVYSQNAKKWFHAFGDTGGV